MVACIFGLGLLDMVSGFCGRTWSRRAIELSVILYTVHTSSSSLLAAVAPGVGLELPTKPSPFSRCRSVIDPCYLISFHSCKNFTVHHRTCTLLPDDGSLMHSSPFPSHHTSSTGGRRAQFSEGALDGIDDVGPGGAGGG